MNAIHDGVHLAVSIFECAVGGDDKIGAARLLRGRPLRGDALARLDLAHPPLAQPHELALRRTGRDDDAVELLLGAGFVEQRHIHDRERILADELEAAQPGLDRPVHGGVNDRFEILPRRGIGEHDRSELGAVHRAVGGQNVRAEPIHNRQRRLGAGGRDAVGQGVGVEAGDAAAAQHVQHVALAGRDPASQCDPKHRSSAARSVFFSNIAIVRGPTPPGTGVRAPATSATSGCTSPTTTDPRRSNVSRPFAPGAKIFSTADRSLSRLMPTSTTVAPGFTNARVTNAGRPIAATRMSASRATAGRSRVREWQIVTVAFRCSSSSAIGLPTMSLRPMTTARAPAMGMFYRSSSSMMPEGVAGATAARFWTSRPTLTGWNPSTSLSGRIASKTRRSAASPSAGGSGDWTRMASWTSLRFSRSTTASSWSSVVVAGSRSRSARTPTSPAAFT